MCTNGRVGVVIVETKIVGSTQTESLDVEVRSGIGSLRELLVLLVRRELAAYEERRVASTVLRVLTPADLALGVDQGSYGREGRVLPGPPPEREAIERALEAYGDGLAFVFLDGVQIESLDAPIDVRPDSTLRLVRLVALAGG